MPAQPAKAKDQSEQNRIGGRAGGVDPHVEAMRRFSRFYTRKIGLLQEEFLGRIFR